MGLKPTYVHTSACESRPVYHYVTDVDEGYCTTYIKISVTCFYNPCCLPKRLHLRTIHFFLTAWVILPQCDYMSARAATADASLAPAVSGKQCQYLYVYCFNSPYTFIVLTVLKQYCSNSTYAFIVLTVLKQYCSNSSYAFIVRTVLKPYRYKI